MPVSWKMRGGILVLTLDTQATFKDISLSIDAALVDPRSSGMCLMLDVRRSLSSLQASEMTSKADWFASLRFKGLGPRCALVAGRAPVRFDLARLVATHLESAGMETSVFEDWQEAREWLGAERSEGSGAT